MTDCYPKIVTFSHQKPFFHLTRALGDSTSRPSVGGMSVLEPVYGDLTVLRNIRWGLGARAEVSTVAAMTQNEPFHSCVVESSYPVGSIETRDMLMTELSAHGIRKTIRKRNMKNAADRRNITPSPLVFNSLSVR